MSNPNLPLSASPASPASPAGIMSPSDLKPMASDEDETMHSDEDDTSSVDKLPSYLPYFSFSEPRSCIFWDVVDFPLPNGVDPVSIYQRMTTFTQSKCPEDYELSIILYVDDMEGYDAFKSAGFTIFSREGIVQAGAYFMLLDIAMWVSENLEDYPVLMVISKKIRKNWIFFDYFYYLAERSYNVLLTVDNIPDGPSEKEYSLSSVSFEYLGRLLLGGVEPSSDHKRKSVEEAGHSTSSQRQKVDESS